MNNVQATSGSVGHERLFIRGFKTSQAMHKFLNSQSDNHWQESKHLNLKPGVYAFIGGQWQNVKSLPSSVLSHC